MQHFLDQFQSSPKLDYEDTDMKHLAMGLVVAQAVGWALHRQVSTGSNH